MTNLWLIKGPTFTGKEISVPLILLEFLSPNSFSRAALKGDRGLAKHLLRHGASPFDRTEKFNLTPLHLAVEGGHLDLVVDLLSWMEDCWPQDEPFRPDLWGHKTSAWQDAIHYGQWEVLYNNSH